MLLHGVAATEFCAGGAPQDEGAGEVRHEPSSGYEDPSLNYRVTWQSVDEGGTTHERIFTSRDQGWDFYEQKKRSAGSYNATWEHIPA